MEMWQPKQLVFWMALMAAAGGCGQSAQPRGVSAPTQSVSGEQSSNDDLADDVRAAIMAESEDARRAAMKRLLAAADQGAARPVASALFPYLGDASGNVRDRAKQAILDMSRRGEESPLGIAARLDQMVQHGSLGSLRHDSLLKNASTSPIRRCVPHGPTRFSVH